MKTPRWLWISEALLIVVGALLLGYMMRMRILPLGRVEQPRPRITDPREQALEYSVKYPERFIRVGDESWKYDQSSRTAFHSFTLSNSGTVAYRSIRIRLVYRSAEGKELVTRSLELPGRLAARGSRKVSTVKMTNIPAASDTVLLEVVGAVVDQPQNPR
jgi:hypothetical protein